MGESNEPGHARGWLLRLLAAGCFALVFTAALPGAATAQEDGADAAAQNADAASPAEQALPLG
ncbi:MAG: hypothetical protein AAF589_05160, partial [Planctomycetota bacterium]